MSGGNRANHMLRSGAFSKFPPTPFVLSIPELSKWRSLHIASFDIYQFKNLLRTLSFFLLLLFLPRIFSQLVKMDTSTSFSVPCLIYVSMASSFPVPLAKAVSIAIIRRTSLSAPQLLTDIFDTCRQPRDAFPIHRE